jgi:hypothetical protein
MITTGNSLWPACTDSLVWPLGVQAQAVGEGFGRGHRRPSAAGRGRDLARDR